MKMQPSYSDEYNEYAPPEALYSHNGIKGASKQKPTPKPYLGYMTIVLSIVSCVALCGVYLFPPNFAEHRKLKGEIRDVKKSLEILMKNSSTNQNIQTINDKIAILEKAVKKTREETVEIKMDISENKRNINKIKDEMRTLDDIKDLSNQNKFDINVIKLDSASLRDLLTEVKDKITQTRQLDTAEHVGIFDRLQKLENDNNVTKKKLKKIENKKEGEGIFGLTLKEEFLYYFCEDRRKRISIDKLGDICEEIYDAGLPTIY